jgi:hypothetical protein
LIRKKAKRGFAFFGIKTWKYRSVFPALPFKKGSRSVLPFLLAFTGEK